MNRTAATAFLALLIGCGNPEGPSSDNSASTGAESTQGSTGEITSTVAGSVGGTTDPSGSTSGSVTAASDDASSGGADSSSSGSTGEPPPEVPAGVFLWTGSGGGGPGTDLYPDAVLATLTDAGVDAELGDALPADFEARFGTLVYLNPTEDFDPPVNAAATNLVEAGGRVVLVMEHCKNGCWGNAEGHNDLLSSLGSSLRMVGDGGAPLSDTALVLTPTPPLTDGVSDLIVYYSGHVEVGVCGAALGAMDGGDVIIGVESLGWGEVVAVADSSVLGYRLASGDNERFVQNWALH